MLRALLVCLLSGCTAGARPRAEAEAVVPLVATAEVKGTTEPCGCNSDPLGDVARVVALAKGGLLLDAGGLEHEDRTPPEKKPQADAKAQALREIYGAAARVELAPAVRTLAGIRVGTFGATTAEQAKTNIAALQQKGAQVVVALLPVTRTEARAILSSVEGVSFGVVGREVGEGMAEAEPVGAAFLVAPADQGRRVARIELHVRKGDLKLQPFGGEAARLRAIERAKKRKATLETQLAAWKNDPTADAAFIKARTEEMLGLANEVATLERARTLPPEGSYFTYELVPVRRALPRDPAVEKRLRALDKQIGAANFAAAQQNPAPAAEPGAPRFVGMAACEKCHKPAVEFWRKTVHARAWKTLVEVDKQYNYDCIGCHVTGWQKPGGVNLGSAEKMKLVDVQCEVCHGAGSKHVEEDGLEEPKSLTLRPADRFCADNCHVPEHSDTFQLQAYLRDVLGKGHGEKARAKLGAGATGHELRQKALKAAGAH